MGRHSIGKKMFWSDRDGDKNPRQQTVYKKTGFGSNRRVKGTTYDPKKGKFEKKK